MLGATGFEKIYGLSASFGYLFGVTDEGRIWLIDANTGEASVFVSTRRLALLGSRQRRLTAHRLVDRSEEFP